MSFYVYENWTHDRARIHRGKCGYCNDGQGTQNSSSNRNGQWLGPYPDRETAVRVARAKNRSDTRECGACNP